MNDPKSDGSLSAVSVTVGNLICSVLGRPSGGFPEEPPTWPPDVFAVAAVVLKRTGAYLCIASGKDSMATAEESKPFADELPTIQKVAARWQVGTADNPSADKVPREIRRWWREIGVASRSDMATDEVLANMSAENGNESLVDSSRTLVRNLFRLMVAADEASRGAGLYDMRPGIDSSGFHLRCANNLFWRWWDPTSQGLPDSRDPLSSLCELVHPTRAVVLPKIHVSQAGLTLNSLSRHLALCDPGSDVAPVWRWIPSTYHLRHEKAGINVLVIPYPFQVFPTSFTGTHSASVDKAAGYFSCQAADLTENVRKQIIAAASIVEERLGRLDVLVLPELAAETSGFEELCHELGIWVREKLHARDGMVVVAGVGQKSDTGRGQNQVAVSSQLAGIRIAPGRQQSKHHRWRIDGSQVRQYGLGSRLDPNKVWWENIDISQRTIYFWSAGWLTASVLICEDLARQEPIAELVRAVGPNLVIALLADGPQLEHRWSGRYAAVLADDPGCSVLTLTSLGMAAMSRPPGKPESRVIALWKDASGGAVQIDLPAGGFGVALSLTTESVAKVTADGRSGILASKLPVSNASRLRLAGIHPITVNDVEGRKQPEKSSEERPFMLKSYQSAAIAIALFSLIHSKRTMEFTDGWPSDLTAFSKWLSAQADNSPPTEHLGWCTVDDQQHLKSFIRFLYGAAPIDHVETWARAAAQDLNNLLNKSRNCTADAADNKKP